MSVQVGLSSKFLHHFCHLEGDIWLVPSIANYEENSFTPLFRPLSELIEGPTIFSKKEWTEQEDEVLKNIVETRGANSWTLVAKEINGLFHRGKPQRAPRKCRERWINHLDSSVNKGNWTTQEDVSLLELQLKHGNKWSKIAKKLEGRTDNSVKNRWKSLVKDTPDPESVQRIIRGLLGQVSNESESLEDQLVLKCESVHSVSPSDFLK